MICPLSERVQPCAVGLPFLQASGTDRREILKQGYRQVMAAAAIPNGTDTAKPLHGSGMPLTEYSANPSTSPSTKSSASASVPPEFLLPDGYPDVSTAVDAPLRLLANNYSTSGLSLRLVSTMLSKKPP